MTTKPAKRRRPLRIQPVSLSRRFINFVPGKATFGAYRFLPFFFALGAALEFTMIKWTFGQTNFYNTYKKRQALKAIEEEAEENALQQGEQ